MNNVQIINGIKLDFLSLLRDNKSGYFITLEKLYTWLEMPQVYANYISDGNYRRNFRKRYLRCDKLLLDESVCETDLEQDFIMRKENGINMPWFSNEGFKTFCMVVNEPKSNYVRKYFIQIEKDYMRVLKQTAEITAKELQILNTDLANAKSSIIKISDSSEQTLQQNLELQHKLKKTQTLEVILDEQDDFCSNGNAEYKEYLYLRELYMKHIPLYIVKKEFVEMTKFTNKLQIPEVNDSDPDFTELISNLKPLKIHRKKKLQKIITDLHYRKNYNDYQFTNDICPDQHSGEESPTLYYYLGGFTEKAEKNTDTHYKICNINVLDKEHLDQIKLQLLNCVAFGKRWTYKTTYTHIYNISLHTSNERLRNVLIN